MRSFSAGGFRRLRAAGYFAHGGKVTKTPPGTAQDGHFVSIFAFPRTPLRGTRTCQVLQYFRRAKFEWLSAIPSGPPGPGFAKIAAGAVPLSRLALPSKRSWCWIRRRGGCPHPPAVLGNRPLSSVGAAISRPQAFPLAGGRCRAYARRMRVGFGMAEPSRRAGQCPAPTKKKGPLPNPP